MKIAMIGTGYVGLVSGTCFAEVGHSVICMDIDAGKITKLKKGIIPIYEPGLEELVKRNAKEGRLTFTTDIKIAVESADIVFSAVGTPLSENHEADLKYVKQVARDFGRYINGPKIFVIKSTVPVGTSEEVTEEIRKAIEARFNSPDGRKGVKATVPDQGYAREYPKSPITFNDKSSPETPSVIPDGKRSVPDQESPWETASNITFDVVSNPEFLREGTAVKDFMVPDRIIVGIDDNAKDFGKGGQISNPYSLKPPSEGKGGQISNLSPLKPVIPDGKTEPLSVIPDGKRSAPDQESQKPSIDTRSIMQKLYEPIIRVGSPLIFTDIRSAEIIKYASNAFLATKISFINEIANFCDKVGGDVKEIAKGIGLDKRIGPKFLHAGVGYGGSCFPKDVKALIEKGKREHCEFQILRAVEEVNHMQREKMFYKIKKALGSIEGKTIAVWGLSFKPKTDDMRKAPSLYVIKKLQAEGGKIQVFDPVAQKNAQKSLAKVNITYYDNAYDACKMADALVIMTEWNEFRAVDFEKLGQLMKGRIIVDGRNMYKREDIEEAGYEYVCFGR